MKLYFTPGTCSLAAHIIIREAGLDVQLVKVDLATKLLDDGTDYRTINARGQVPALEIDAERTLVEGPAIQQYLADLNLDAGLAPANGTFERYRLQSWLNFISTELHKGFSPLWKKDTPEAAQQQAKAQLAERFTLLDQHLADRIWILDGFTAADAYAFAILRWSRFFAIDLARWPNLSAFMARVEARPAVRAALREEGLLPAAAAA